MSDGGCAEVSRASFLKARWLSQGASQVISGGLDDRLGAGEIFAPGTGMGRQHGGPEAVHRRQFLMPLAGSFARGGLRGDLLLDCPSPAIGFLVLVHGRAYRRSRSLAQSVMLRNQQLEVRTIP